MRVPKPKKDLSEFAVGYNCFLQTHYFTEINFFSITEVLQVYSDVDELSIANNRTKRELAARNTEQFSDEERRIAGVLNLQPFIASFFKISFPNGL